MTQDYRGEPPSGTPPERLRVALVAGSGSVEAGDLYRLLRRRLLIVCTILAVLFAVLVSSFPISSSTIPDPDDRIDLSQWLEWSWRLLLMATTAAVLAAILWRRPPRTVSGLRFLELVFIGTLVFGALHNSNVYWHYLEEAARQQTMSDRFPYIASYVAVWSRNWFVILTLYGTFIPNTWRRCAIVVAVLGGSPLILLVVQGTWLRPLVPQVFWPAGLTYGIWLTLGAVVSVLACSRLEILQRQAGEARKLGQYVLKEKLGGGGMGEVYRAEHALLRRPCALKVIRPERAVDPKNLRRFEREVQTTATLTHPNTVQIFDYGHAEDGTFYYVMEYLPGLTLEELVKREGPLPPARAIHFLRQICGALKEAHGRGLIHRDIKPGNVMICERGGIANVAKLLDFGLVLPAVSETDGEKLTQDGMVTGTPAYLSPEQAGGQDKVDARSDIYSLGALAYFLLTGQPPFAGRSGVKMLAAHLYEEPERLVSRRPDIPPDLEAVVLRCLAKDPERRFADVESLDVALAGCCIDIGVECDGQPGRTNRST
jgi:eukaryotic-like serine/threonine-protein kinase